MIAAVVGLYSFFYTPKAHVTVINRIEFNVLDIRQAIPGLEILYNRRNFDRTRQNLLASRVRVINDGEVDIAKNYYDGAQPLAIHVENGTLLQARFIDGSSQYLRETVSRGLLVGENAVVLPPVLFERGEYFEFELILLHDVGIRPTILPTGKVLGVRQIAYVKEESEFEQGPSFLAAAFGGPLSVQSARVAAYSLVGVVLLAIVIFVAVNVADAKGRLRRSRRRKLLSQTSRDEGIGFPLWLSDGYVGEGYRFLNRIERLAGPKAAVHGNMSQHELLRKESEDLLNIMLADKSIVDNGDEYRISRRLRRQLDTLRENLRKTEPNSEFQP